MGGMHMETGRYGRTIKRVKNQRWVGSRLMRPLRPRQRFDTQLEMLCPARGCGFDPVPSAVESAYSIRGSVDSLAEALSSFLAVFGGVLPKVLPKPEYAFQSSSATSSASWST